MSFATVMNKVGHVQVFQFWLVLVIVSLAFLHNYAIEGEFSEDNSKIVKVCETLSYFQRNLFKISLVEEGSLGLPHSSAKLSERFSSDLFHADVEILSAFKIIKHAGDSWVDH